MEQEERQREWMKVARNLGRSLRFGWWLEFLSVPLILVVLCGGALLMYLRYRQLEPTFLFFSG